MSVDYLNILTNRAFPLLQGVLSSFTNIFWPGPISMGDQNGSYFVYLTGFSFSNFSGPVEITWDTRSDAPYTIANMTNLDLKVTLIGGYVLINTEYFKSNCTMQFI